MATEANLIAHGKVNARFNVRIHTRHQIDGSVFSPSECPAIYTVVGKTLQLRRETRCEGPVRLQEHCV